MFAHVKVQISRKFLSEQFNSIQAINGYYNFAAQVLLSNGGKNGLNENILGQNLSLISVTALQKQGPIPITWTLASELNIPKAQPSVLVIDDQHSIISVILTGFGVAILR
ncbi:hypothetical protein Dsin_017810 [Dipteronia sinensis]|uniref:Uncharacterized protein n=1 Tax=Dipteronia sinensis TaxID=43782 RepID=A0AAE0AG00_9ROSI|nr:hypothetical protein Dsin_017810 [Dipteronia sinensis]